MGSGETRAAGGLNTGGNLTAGRPYCEAFARTRTSVAVRAALPLTGLRMTVHELLDWRYGPDGDLTLRRGLEEGADVDTRHPASGETPLHAAVRRRRLAAARILLDHGAAVDAPTAGGKTAWTHAVRRGFDEVAELLAERGADTRLAPADAFAVAVVSGRLDEAAALLADDPTLARTGNPEEDRLLADVAGRPDLRPVRFLVEAGAPLDLFDRVHESSPLHWAVHGSRHSGDAEGRQDAYRAIVSLLLEAGSALHHPDDPGGHAYLRRLHRDASDPVRVLLPPLPGQRGDGGPSG